MTKSIQQRKLSPINPPTTSLNKASYRDNKRELSFDTVLVEQPLQITLKWYEVGVYSSRVFSITMRTPGNDKILIFGLLMAEGIIKNCAEVESIVAEHDENRLNENGYENLWLATLAKGITPQLSSLEQYQLRYSSCGLCGTTSLKSLELKDPPVLNNEARWLTRDQIKDMPVVMRKHQLLFSKTGGSHATALFDDNNNLLGVQEDIGRHNALDKLNGAFMMQTDIRNMNKKLCVVVSGRISFEIVQKTVMAGISVLAAVGAPSDLAVIAAKRFDLTLIGFVSEQSFNVYHGDWRIIGN